MTPYEELIADICAKYSIAEIDCFIAQLLAIAALGDAP